MTQILFQGFLKTKVYNCTKSQLPTFFYWVNSDLVLKFFLTVLKIRNARNASKGHLFAHKMDGASKNDLLQYTLTSHLGC